VQGLSSPRVYGEAGKVAVVTRSRYLHNLFIQKKWQAKGLGFLLSIGLLGDMKGH